MDVLDISATPPSAQAPRADLFLLKSRSDAALALAAEVESQGAIVVNSHDATATCLDRAWAALLLDEAGIRSPRTRAVPALRGATSSIISAMGLTFPLIVKSRRSRKGDLVTSVGSQLELDGLKPQWGAEPVILQEYLPSDGWDVKAWGIGDAVFLAQRRSPLTAAAGDPRIPEHVAAECTAVAALAGRAFGLSLYGVDLLITPAGPAVIDVNAFPGFRSVPNAHIHLAGLVKRLLEEGRS